MVLFILCVKADLEGVSSVLLRKPVNLCISVKNPLSDFEKREKIILSTDQYMEQEENSREPPCHFALKWEGSKKRSTIEVLVDEATTKSALKKSGGGHKKGDRSRNTPRDLTATDSGGDYVPVLALECRGVEPYAFHPISDEFIVTSEGGTMFNEGVDLSEGDWADYDAENDMSVSISNFQSKFIVA
jgi:hypothetical protein